MTNTLTPSSSAQLSRWAEGFHLNHVVSSPLGRVLKREEAEQQKRIDDPFQAVPLFPF